MRVIRYYIVLLLLLLSVNKVYSQVERTSISVDFRVNKTSIDRGFSDNAVRLSEIDSCLQEIEKGSTLALVGVSFYGAASPEGSYQLNRRLARGRLEALESFVRSEMEIPDSIITRSDTYIPWEYLREQVVKSDIMQKQKVLDIIAQEPRLVDYPGGRHIDSRIVDLQSLDGGKVWRHLHRTYFERMRNAQVVFTIFKREKLHAVEQFVPQTGIVKLQETGADDIIRTRSQFPAVMIDDWTRRLHIRTNAIGWGLAISNIGAEIDLAKHWSFALPVYYSALDYFTSTIKFRTLAVQPELRYWFSEDNQQFFAGAHFGYAQYNFAFGGDYRYQDHRGKSPAIGGGISAGYRMPVSKDGKWNIEFTLGAGVYGLHYDRFYNVSNGKLYDTSRKTYWGIDNAAVNISYRFDLKKRKK